MLHIKDIPSNQKYPFHTLPIIFKRLNTATIFQQFDQLKSFHITINDSKSHVYELFLVIESLIPKQVPDTINYGINNHLLHGRDKGERSYQTTA